MKCIAIKYFIITSAAALLILLSSCSTCDIKILGFYKTTLKSDSKKVSEVQKNKRIEIKNGINRVGEGEGEISGMIYKDDNTKLTNMYSLAYAETKDDPSEEKWQNIKSSNDGKFMIVGLASGTYKILAHDSGTFLEVKNGIKIDEDTPKAEVELMLK